ncbi:MAG: AtaL-like protein [Crinalium sp.]
MLSHSFSTPVNASIDQVWTLLVDKIENPQRYVKSVEKSQVLEKYQDGVLREMEVGGMKLKERITVDEANREIKFTLVDNALFSGEIINKIDVFEPENTLTLTFTQNWQPLNAEAQKIYDKEMTQAIKNAVLHTKDLAQQQES